MKNPPNILVTGVGGRSVGHQILQALLPLGDKYSITVTDANPFSFGLYEVANRYIVPLANDKTYISSIKKIIRQNKIDVILPGTEVEVRTLSAQEAEISNMGCSLIASQYGAVNLCSNKWDLYRWLKDHNFDTPTTVLANDWERLTYEFGFPIVGKPAKNTGGSRSVSLLNNKEEVEKYLAHNHDIVDDLIFQEYVGSGEHEYTVGVLISKQGNVIDSIVIHRKLEGLSLGEKRVIGDQTYHLSTGYSQGFVIKNPNIQKKCEKLALDLGISGPVNIQCRCEGDTVKIFEVHPRFSGTTSIRAAVGFNEPDVLIRNFLNNEIFTHLDYQYNVAAIRAFKNIIVPCTEMRKVPKI